MSFVMVSLIDQLKQRRLGLGMKQHDMLLRIGMSRQQYQRLESKGNPRLDTLELIVKGLKSEIMLIPLEKRKAVQAILEYAVHDASAKPEPVVTKREHASLVNDPWKGLLEGDQE